MQIRSLKNKFLEFCVKSLRNFTGLLEKQIEPSDISPNKSSDPPISALDDWLERTAGIRDAGWLNFENPQPESPDLEMKEKECFQIQESQKNLHKRAAKYDFEKPEIKRRNLASTDEIFVRDSFKSPNVRKKNRLDKKEEKFEKTKPLLSKSKEKKDEKRTLKKEGISEDTKRKPSEYFKLLPSRTDKKSPPPDEMIGKPENSLMDEENLSQNAERKTFKNQALKPHKNRTKKAPQIRRSKLKTSSGGYVDETFRQTKSAKSSKFAERPVKRILEKNPVENSKISKRDKIDKRKNKLPSFDLKPKADLVPAFSKDRDVYLLTEKRSTGQLGTELQAFKQNAQKVHKKVALESNVSKRESKFPVMDEPKWIELPDPPESDFIDDFETKQIEILHIKALENEQADLD